MPHHRRPPLPAGTALVVGLARSGIAAAGALRALGLEVIATDSGAPGLEAQRELRDLGVPVYAQTAGLDLLEQASWLVKSPGVPAEAPVVAVARERGLPVLGELELGWRLTSNETLLVTGSNGKSTTVEWLGHVYRMAGLPVCVAGNVGTALSGLAGTLDPAATLVVEASSFQLEDAVALAPEAAVLLNITPDHLDRHGSFAAYRDAKLRAFAHQRPGDIAVVPHDPGAVGGEPVPEGAATLVTFGGPGADLADTGTELSWHGERVIAAEEIALPGAHNRANAAAVAAVALARGLGIDAVREGLRTFGGVPHRLELVARVAGVDYVNDSKATNVAAAITGIASYDGGVHAILGGHGEDGDIAALARSLAGRAVAAYLIGASAERLAGPLRAAGVPVTVAAELERALAAAHAAARPGETVLLSPAYKSFDQYPDFEVRGEHFRALVRRLPTNFT